MKSKRDWSFLGETFHKYLVFEIVSCMALLVALSLGLLNFLFTSKSLKSVNFSVYSFSFIAMAYWIQCRFNYSKTKFEMLQMQEKFRKHAILEGSEDPSLLKKMDEVVEV